ncbi:hypothetical protein LPTSP3_g16810 [Leptospira kobayashii]|uniref:Uncharacterized protein n=2 Tax=Leptospira kobayashii TaxID=1917830 RepID=A0ABN6KEW7_9LEPT|nr:hypothetical protein LPTSP3_g16810 [Leptospira kobayashii]
MNEEQKNASKVLKQKVVALKNEVSSQKKTNELTSQSIKISKSKILKHSAVSSLLREKEKLALLKDDSQGAKRYLDEAQSSDLEKSKEETRLLVWIQKEKEDTAYLAMKESLLSESIAELELVRAEIAVKFQESQGKTPKDEDFIKKQTFESQYGNRKTETRKKTADWERVKNEAQKLPKVNIEDTLEDAK